MSGLAGEPWLLALKVACSRHGLRGTARELGVSPALVSLTVNGRRKNTDFLKSRVESRLMGGERRCPVLGVIESNVCLREQAKPLVTCNPVSVRLFRACRNGCKYYETKENPHVR